MLVALSSKYALEWVVGAHVSTIEQLWALRKFFVTEAHVSYSLPSLPIVCDAVDPLAGASTVFSRVSRRESAAYRSPSAIRATATCGAHVTCGATAVTTIASGACATGAKLASPPPKTWTSARPRSIPAIGGFGNLAAVLFGAQHVVAERVRVHQTAAVAAREVLVAHAHRAAHRLLERAQQQRRRAGRQIGGVDLGADDAVHAERGAAAGGGAHHDLLADVLARERVPVPPRAHRARVARRARTQLRVEPRVGAPPPVGAVERRRQRELRADPRLHAVVQAADAGEAEQRGDAVARRAERRLHQEGRRARVARRRRGPTAW